MNPDDTEIEIKTLPVYLSMSVPNHREFVFSGMGLKSEKVKAGDDGYKATLEFEGDPEEYEYMDIASAYLPDGDASSVRSSKISLASLRYGDMFLEGCRDSITAVLSFKFEVNEESGTVVSGVKAKVEINVAPGQLTDVMLDIAGELSSDNQILTLVECEPEENAVDDEDASDILGTLPQFDVTQDA